MSTTIVDNITFLNSIPVENVRLTSTELKNRYQVITSMCLFMDEVLDNENNFGKSLSKVSL
jgi:hypothetical protein